MVRVVLLTLIIVTACKSGGDNFSGGVFKGADIELLHETSTTSINSVMDKKVRSSALVYCGIGQPAVPETGKEI